MVDPFTQTRDPRVASGSVSQAPRQYFDLAKEPSSPSLSASYQRTAEDYRVRALERQGVSSAQRT
jgi:hypothetical protein